MKKCFSVTVFLIVNLFFLPSKSLSDNGESPEYSPYSYSYQTYSVFPSEEGYQPFSSEKKFNYRVDYDLIDYMPDLEEDERLIFVHDLPPGFEDSDGIGTEFPVGNLIPLVLFSGIYVCRIILKKKKRNKMSLYLLN